MRINKKIRFQVGVDRIKKVISSTGQIINTSKRHQAQTLCKRINNSESNVELKQSIPTYNTIRTTANINKIGRLYLIYYLT